MWDGRLSIYQTTKKTKNKKEEALLWASVLVHAVVILSGVVITYTKPRAHKH